MAEEFRKQKEAWRKKESELHCVVSIKIFPHFVPFALRIINELLNKIIDATNANYLVDKRTSDSN